MSRQQMIDTYFWDDPWVQKLKPMQRYLFLYLLTNPLTNICGVYEITDARIQRDSGLSDPELKKFLKQFEEDGKVYRCREYLIMRNWPKRQNIKSPQVQKAYERILMALPLDVLEFMDTVGYQYPQLKFLIELRKPQKPATPESDDKDDSSTGCPQEDEVIPHADGTKQQTIPHPYGIDTQSHFTSPHLTSLHSTESENQQDKSTEKNPALNQSLNKLLNTLIIQGAGR